MINPGNQDYQKQIKECIKICDKNTDCIAFASILKVINDEAMKIINYHHVTFLIRNFQMYKLRTNQLKT